MARTDPTRTLAAALGGEAQAYASSTVSHASVTQSFVRICRVRRSGFEGCTRTLPRLGGASSIMAGSVATVAALSTTLACRFICWVTFVITTFSPSVITSMIFSASVPCELCAKQAASRKERRIQGNERQAATNRGTTKAGSGQNCGEAERRGASRRSGRRACRRLILRPARIFRGGTERRVNSWNPHSLPAQRMSHAPPHSGCALAQWGCVSVGPTKLR